MTRVMTHTNGPMGTSAYSIQGRQLLYALKDLGYAAACSAFYGLSGGAIKWEGFPVFPAGIADYGLDVIVPHALTFKADLVIPLMDLYRLGPVAGHLKAAPFKLAPWMPVDCSPPGKVDQQLLAATGATPIAMSRFGEQQLRNAGFSPLYVPHSVDTTVFRPLPEDQVKEMRKDAGFGDRFTVLMVGMNHDAIRKGFSENLWAFVDFHRKCKDSVLLVHTVASSPHGLDLRAMASDYGLRVREPAQQDDRWDVDFSDEYQQVGGWFVADMMCGMYNAADVLLLCSYGEGFGVPLIEAQACGTPVITGSWSAMDELAGPGWRVPHMERRDRFWNPVHHAKWYRPDQTEITRALYKAHAEKGGAAAAARSQKCAEFAASYDCQAVRDTYWKPVLAELTEGT